MSDESEQLARRDRIMRAHYAAMMPRQRLTRMAELEAQSMDVLRRNPEAFQRFWRRNLRARAVPPDPETGR